MKRYLSIFAAGLAFRLAAIAYLAHVKPYMVLWGSNEVGAIARSIVISHSFSAPFHDASGPTAWLGPIYPFIVAGAFLLFGVQSSASVIAVMIFNSICSAATGSIVYELGKVIHSEAAGLLAGWMWAFSFPLAILPFILWDTSLSALALGGVFLLSLKLWSGESGRWALCGIGWGIAALITPALGAPLPILALLLLRGGKRWRQVGTLAVFAMLAVLPWTVRNYVVFHELLPIRSNGLAEVYFATYGFETHPFGPSMEYQRLGETAFVAQANRHVAEYVRTYPIAFLRDYVHRIPQFWFYPMNSWPLTAGIDISALIGLMAVFRKLRGLAGMLLALLATYPLIYYGSFIVSRYRHPIEPILYALSGVALSGLALKRCKPSGEPRANLDLR